MQIYMDNCAIQRPLDDKTNLRNRIEAEAVMGLFELIEQKKIELVNSHVLLFELNNTPDPERIEFGKKVLSLCKHTLPLSNEVVEKAQKLENIGTKVILPTDLIQEVVK